MGAKSNYSNEPVENSHVVRDFLLSPEELAFREAVIPTAGSKGRSA
jgi:hypothetical protein